MTRTITLYELLKQEYLRTFYTDLVDKGRNQITFYSKKDRVLSRLIAYSKEDTNILEVARYSIFYGLGDYLKEDVRHQFEHDFINRFINRRFNYQTYEIVSAKLSSIVSSNANIINSVYDNEFILGHSSGNSVINSSGNNRSNAINSSLPQDQVNMDLERELLEYADNNSINKSKFNQNSTTTNSNTKKSVEEVEKMLLLKEKIWLLIDKTLFTQII